MTAMYQNGDIQRLHERIDALDLKIGDSIKDLSDDLSDAAVAIGKIETRLEMAPKAPARPCPELKELRLTFDGHVTDHKETKRLWQRPIMATLLHIAELALIALLGWAFVVKGPPPGAQPAARAETTQPRASGTP